MGENFEGPISRLYGQPDEIFSSEIADLEVKSADEERLYTLVGQIQAAASDSTDETAHMAVMEGYRQAAFSDLIALTHLQTYTFAVQLTGYSEAEAEAVLTEAYERALDIIDEFKQDTTVTKWLCGLVANAYSNKNLADAPRHAMSPSVSPAAPLDAVEDTAVNSEPKQAETIQEALSALPIQARTVVVMRTVGYFDYPEIAQIIGVPEERIRAQYDRGFHLLRQSLPAAESS